jgi:hypothetical protein
MKTTKNAVVVLVVAALSFMAVLSAIAGSAAAHTCRTYSDECDPNGCVDGEDHDHTRMHGPWKRDEHCSSSADEPPASGCQYNGIDVPGRVCDLLEDSEDKVGAAEFIV